MDSIKDKYLNEGYTLVWHDEFDGDTLNTEDWNVELHEPGWVNEELQRYTALEDGNIELGNGSLYLKPHYEGAASGGDIRADVNDKKLVITSGRITTQNKHDFKYGRFEARVKVPRGKGYLPAFWLMATDEPFYGQWPRCGEIDIMEVMGHETDKSYHTIHYGYNAAEGHRENQGSLTLDGGDFADDYHVFRLDWEEKSLTWYVDDKKVFSTSDWFSGEDENKRLPYPAPFDQNFYIILNLAVGGSWVGYPDDEAFSHMNKDSFAVDYVRVYQHN